MQFRSQFTWFILTMRILLVISLLLCAACANTAVPEHGAAVTPFPAPDFTLPTLTGGTFALDSMRGRWVILNFWATWCSPCINEMPALQTIATERSGQVALFGINMRESADDIRKFMGQYHVNFPMLLNPDDTMTANYSLDLGIPQTVLVSPQGMVVWHQFGAIDLASFRSTLEGFITGKSSS